MGIDVSVVITLHAEGQIAHRTLRALKASIDFAILKGLSLEVVTVLDNVSDPVLKNVVDKWVTIFEGILSVHEVGFGALSLSRNFGISKSRGQFISILDGDDLYGENWLYAAHQMCTKDHRIIAHPEAFFLFPLEPYLSLLSEDELTYLDLMSHNKWRALLMAHRNTFSRIPYVKDDQTFAYQDWLWNCETVSKGYHHILVPRTIMAIRQKRQGKSLWQNSDALNKVVRPNSLYHKFFTLQYETERKTLLDRRKKNPIVGFFYNLVSPWIKSSLDHLALNRKSLYNNLIWLKRAVASGTGKVLKSRYISDWICEELDKLLQLEPALENFSAAQIRSITNTFNHFCAIDEDMGKLVRTANARIYISDALASSSTTLSMLLYMHAVESPIFVVTTERSNNPWKRFLPKNCIHIDIGNKDLFFEEKLRLFHRLLLQTDIDYLHLFDSQLGFEMLNRYPGTFGDCSVFSSIPEMDLECSKAYMTRKVTIFDDVFECFSKISANSIHLRNRFLKIYGLFDEQVIYHRYPFAPHLTSRILAADGISFPSSKAAGFDQEELNILWIGDMADDRYKNTRAKITRGLNKKKIRLNIGFRNGSGFTGRQAGGGLAQLVHRSERIGKSYHNKPTAYDMVVVENVSTHQLPFLIHCIGYGIPVLTPATDVPCDLTENEGLLIAVDLSDAKTTSQTILDLILHSEEFENRYPKAKRAIESRYAWKDFTTQISEFYRESEV